MAFGSFFSSISFRVIGCITMAVAYASIVNVAYAKESDQFSFAVIADMPYGLEPRAPSKELEQLATEVNADPDIKWVLHLGDIKRGARSCADEVYLARRDRFYRFKAPFVFTPGDNEWTDCHRYLAGEFVPLERLSSLRKIFYENARAKKDRATLNVMTQASVEENAYIENYMWVNKGVRFVTVHVVGSLNGRYTYSNKTKTEKQKNERELREAAAQRWLKKAFDAAKKNNDKAVFIAMHANPGWSKKVKLVQQEAFAFFLHSLRNELIHFKRPVLLAHGDSHTFRIDKPDLFGKPAPSNFKRLEAFGESLNDWVKITVNPNSRSVFQFDIIDHF